MCFAAPLNACVSCQLVCCVQTEKSLLGLVAMTLSSSSMQVFYRSNPAREAFVEMCKSDYVQKMTFDSYLYKTVVPGNPLDDIKLALQTVGSLLRGNALRSSTAKSVSFGSRAGDSEVAVAGGRA